MFGLAVAVRGTLAGMDPLRCIAVAAARHLSHTDALFVAVTFSRYAERAAVLMSAYAGEAMRESEIARLTLRIAKQLDAGSQAS